MSSGVVDKPHKIKCLADKKVLKMNRIVFNQLPRVQKGVMLALKY